ncbi:MAG: single-stranded DNA-binding protein [Candidatus Nanopelagicales bacterium]
MMNETIVTVAGNLVSDVEQGVTSRGDAMARFRVASTVKRYDRTTGTWSDGDTAYWNVTAWRRAAQNAAASLAKGHPVVVHGRIRQRTVDREVIGAPGVSMAVTYTDLEAVSFGLDLSRCRATFQRAPIGPQTADTAGASASDGQVPESVAGVAGAAAVDPAAA